MLRLLIERAVMAGETIDTISLAISRLGQMLRVQHTLSGDAARSVDDALAKILAEIGAELGAA